MPLPMPRWVMSSASHITTAVPAVKMRMMNSTRGAVKSGMRSMLLPVPNSCPLWNRNTRPELCMTASATVR